MYEVKVKFEKVDNDGSVKTVTECYVVSALSVTEAEAITLKELDVFSESGLNVISVKQHNAKEVFFTDKNNDELNYFNVKLSFVTIDEVSAKEKKTTVQVLVQSKDTQSAISKIEEEFKTYVTDYTIELVSTTKIVNYLSGENV